ncbi:MAG: hypothetical protein ABI614_05855 [Planctomycetota bacterium]
MKTVKVDFRRFALSGMAVAVVSVLTLAPALAEDPAVKPRLQAPPHDVAIPSCLESLSLSPQQQDQIQKIVRDNDTNLASVWKQFGQRYLETVRTEAMLLAAIEDNFTEPQRMQVRQQRRKTAQHQQAVAGTDLKPNQATTKPESAVEEEIGIVGVSLTAEQEEAADKLQEKYLSRLRSLNRDIQGMHTRLVSLEADKLVQIEEVLTTDQLAQLREIRQNAPAAANVATGRTSPSKTE